MRYLAVNDNSLTLKQLQITMRTLMLAIYSTLSMQSEQYLQPGTSGDVNNRPCFLHLFGETRLPGVLLKFSNKRSHFCVLLGLWLPMLTCEPTTSSSSCPSPSPTGPCHLPLSRSESETSCQWLGWTSLCGGLTTAGQPQVHIWGRL